MRHIIVSEKVKCSKCSKEHMGATVSILEFYVCGDCFYAGYDKYVLPFIEEIVRNYFQPERSKPEAL